MPNPNYFQKSWESFSKAARLENTSAIQRREMRRAYFAGGVSLISMLLTLLDDTGNPNDVTDFDEQLMNWIQHEFEQYGRDLESGKA